MSFQSKSPLAVSGSTRCGQAQIGIDLFDAPLGAVLVVDDADRAVLDLNVVEPDVAARGGKGGAGGDDAELRRGVLLRSRAGIALLLRAGSEA